MHESQALVLSIISLAIITTSNILYKTTWINFLQNFFFFFLISLKTGKKFFLLFFWSDFFPFIENPLAGKISYINKTNNVWHCRVFFAISKLISLYHKNTFFFFVSDWTEQKKMKWFCHFFHEYESRDENFIGVSTFISHKIQLGIFFLCVWMFL